MKPLFPGDPEYVKWLETENLRLISVLTAIAMVNADDRVDQILVAGLAGDHSDGSVGDG